MIEQLKTIRAGLETATCYTLLGVDAHAVQTALTALAQLEAMVGEPVAWAVYWGLPPTRKNSVHFDKESAQAVANQIKSATEVRPLYATPVAQQPQADTPQATTIAEAARDVGKWLNERPNRPIDLRHVAMLVAHAMQPQAEPHKPLFADLIAQHPGLREELLELREELLEMDEPQADSIPVAAFDRLMALCESQAQRIIELEDKQPQAEAVPSDAMVMAGARALCNRFADTGGVSADDQWAIYSEDFKDDARAVLVAAIKQGGRV